jgi:two-component system, OmpR family, response regulator MprA
MRAASPTRVLIVEDDPDIASALALELGHEGYEARIERDGSGALHSAAEWPAELVVLDLGLPGVDGLEVCRRLRRRSQIPILVLTARDTIQDRVHGLDAGADDYLTKPFSLDELMARVRSTLRRARMREEGERLEYAGLLLDARARTVEYKGRRIELTPREFDLLEFLMRHPAQAMSRDSILTGVWEYDFLGGSNVIDVYIRYLRRKLQHNGAPPMIQTVRGIGYAFRES